MLLIDYFELMCDVMFEGGIRKLFKKEIRENIEVLTTDGLEYDWFMTYEEGKNNNSYYNFGRDMTEYRIYHPAYLTEGDKVRCFFLLS
jgi:hypothetical protein